MIFSRKARWFFAGVVLLTASMMLPSCEGFEDMDEDPKLAVQVLCDGGATDNRFTVNYFIDKKYPISQTIPSIDTNQTMSYYPPDKIESITISATKTNTDSSLTIIIYRDNTIERYANLSGCEATSYSCSNTLVLDYDINEEDDETEGVPLSGSTESGS